MLSTATVREIDRLLRQQQLSQRQIALRLNVSRGIVGAIAKGARGLHGRDPEPSKSYDFAAVGPPQRCPGCGGLVYAPCVLCRARLYFAQRALRRHAAQMRRPHRVA